MDIAHFLAVFTFVNLSSLVYTEIFSSTYQLSALIRLEKSLDQALTSYIQDETIRLEKLKEYLRLKRNSSHVEFNRLSVNPVIVFTNSRKLFKDVKDIEVILTRKSYKQEFLKRLAGHKKSNISNQDFEGAKEALLRLQTVYHISPRAFTEGDIVPTSENHRKDFGKTDSHSKFFNRSRNEDNTHIEHIEQFSSEKIDNSSCVRGTSDCKNSGTYDISGKTEKLTVVDNYVIGRQAYETGRRRQAQLWMENVLGMMGSESHAVGLTTKISRVEIINYLAFLEYQFANLNKALSYYAEMVRLDPNKPLSRYNYNEILKLISSNKPLVPEPDDDTFYITDYIKYMKLCRQADDVMSSPSNDHRLACRYENRHPWLRIKPVAVETISVDPHVEIFRDVLKDEEIDTLIDMAKPRLKRATVNNIDTGKEEAAEYRISQTAWLDDNENEVLGAINQRITALTGLTTDTAESLQINNYGIGGHYEPHYDHTDDISNYSFAGFDTGNRIATFMFYLTDVEAGGRTVFVDAEVISTPRKGDAVFWYNLKKSGKGDGMTFHAGCPVLIGNKWVANKWLHEYGNEFRRPCGLNENE